MLQLECQSRRKAQGKVRSRGIHTCHSLHRCVSPIHARVLAPNLLPLYVDGLVQWMIGPPAKPLLPSPGVWNAVLPKRHERDHPKLGQPNPFAFAYHALQEFHIALAFIDVRAITTAWSSAASTSAVATMPAVTKTASGASPHSMGENVFHGNHDWEGLLRLVVETVFPVANHRTIICKFVCSQYWYFRYRHVTLSRFAIMLGHLLQFLIFQCFSLANEKLVGEFSNLSKKK